MGQETLFLIHRSYGVTVVFPFVSTFSTEEGRTLCTLQHHLHAPGWTVIGREEKEGDIQQGAMDHA